MDEEHCGEFAASFIPRWGWFFPCFLPKGHEGGPESHRAGGECTKHGKYVMEQYGQPPQCPKWPDCAKIGKEKS